MSRVIDALIAYRILKLLVTPFDKTDAFKQGIIDKDGKVLIKSRQIVNQKQRKAYTLLISSNCFSQRRISKQSIYRKRSYKVFTREWFRI